MSVEMMDVGGLTLNSGNNSPQPQGQGQDGGQGYGYDGQGMPVMGRQLSAEEDRMRDKARDAQEQVSSPPALPHL